MTLGSKTWAYSTLDPHGIICINKIQHSPWWLARGKFGGQVYGWRGGRSTCCNSWSTSHTWPTSDSTT